MKKLFIFLAAFSCLSFAQTKIDLGKQKGVVPVVNGGTGNVGQTSVSTSPSAILFGSVKTGTSSPGQNVAISNTGTNPITVSSVALSGTGAAHFNTTNICAGAANVIDAGATCVETVAYNPLTAISETAILTVATSAPVDPLNPLTVALSGTGTGSSTFPLSVNCGGTGSGTITSGETPPLINATCSAGSVSGVFTNNYASGAVVALTATSGGGSTFTTFSGCGLSTSPGNCTVSAATTVNASFNLIPQQFVVTIQGVDSGIGTVTSNVNDVLTGTPISCTSTSGVVSGKCTGTFNKDSVVTLTEAPSGSCTGGACTFVGWGGAAGCTTASTCPLTVSSNITVSADFAQPVGGGPLTLIQTIQGGTTGTNNVSGVFAFPQNAGDLTVCGVLWNDNTTTVSGLSDTKGNTYTQFSSSPKTTAVASLAVYYAFNIAVAAANANTVTAAMSASPSFRKIHCIEYSGVLTTSPLDVNVGATGTAIQLNSGNLTTTVANDLLVGFDNVASNITSTSPSFAQRILISGNDVEDRQALTAGSFSFQPMQATTSSFAAILGAFKSNGATTTQSLTIACAGAGSGTVSFLGLTTTCTAGARSGTFSAAVNSGSAVNLTATPVSGSAFSSYSGGGCGSSPSCTTTAITTNTTITATFNLAGVSNYYVNAATGSDSNSGLCAVAGTPAGCTGPWATRQKANNSFVLGANGTQINVANGTYGALDITRGGTSSAPVLYLCTAGTTGIAAAGKCVSTATLGFANINTFLEAGISYVTVQGFDIGNNVNMGTGIGISGGTPAANNDWAVDNYVHDLGQNVFNTAGTVGPGCPESGAISGGNVASTGLTAIGNFVKNYGVNPAISGCNVAQGIYWAGTNEVYENNLIFKVPVGGVQVQSSVNAIVSNNIIVSTKNCILMEAVSGTPGHNTVANNYCGAYTNMIFFTSSSAKCTTGNGNLFSHNMRDGSGTTFSSGPFSCDSVQDVASPVQAGANVFVSYAADGSGNYLSKSGSPAINAGSPTCVSGGITPCTPNTDFNNVTRPVGTAMDIGAFEQ
jgi:hypothetical protein